MDTDQSAGWRFGRFEIQPAQRLLLIDGEPVALGARAFDLLLALAERRDRVVTKDELLDLVWPGLVVEENNLQVQISSLRKLLGSQAIVTIPGKGYRFTAVEIPHGAPRVTADAVPPPQPNNLPQSPTRFIGREAALADCARLLQGTRLLTLTGIGGCGKTRLALQLARQLLAAFPDGVWFVDLAPLQDAERVAATVAATLGVAEEPGTPLIRRLSAHLATRHLAIVLDNCEHVIDAVVQLTEPLLAACAELTVIATSREALGVAGEQIYPVRSLSLPAATDLEAMQASEAVRVFVDRARLALPDFALDERNAATIAEICRRLDGIALAIELAAARVKLLSVNEIRARLDDRFRLLTGGSRALPRHQTLQATLQWSYEHLSPQEQALFRRLAVFAGGWTLEAATRVAADGADEYEVLERLTALHDKSLLAVDRDGQATPRYRMLETVRQFAQERLNDARDGDATRTRHLLFCVALAEEAGAVIHGRQQAASIARLRLEQENLLAAYGWSGHAPGGAELGLKLAWSLWRYWLASGQVERGYQLAKAALEQAGDGADSLPRGRAIWAIGQFALYMGRYDDALRSAKHSLAMAQRIGDVELTAIGHMLLGVGYHAVGERADALANYEQGCAIARGLSNTSWLATMLNGFGEVHRGAGDFAEAERYYQESIGISRKQDDAIRTGVSLGNLSRLVIAAGQPERAWAMLREGLAIAQAAGIKSLDGQMLEIAAGLAVTLAGHATAARFNGAALARMDESGSRREPVDENFIIPLLARSREALGATTFDLAESGGRALSHDASVAELKRWLNPGEG